MRDILLLRACPTTVKLHQTGKKNSDRDQNCSKPGNNIEIKHYFNPRHLRHLLPAQQKMKLDICAFHEEIHVFEVWIFVRLLSPVLAS